ncbi:hypothetical protein F4776DRAFT_539489 [Hypoxylon sp. NC0597]|nr:hypothetical protein F4776DRAFT_539489 [Hypoxylon sp. NC0597]
MPMRCHSATLRALFQEGYIYLEDRLSSSLSRINFLLRSHRAVFGMRSTSLWWYLREEKTCCIDLDSSQKQLLGCILSTTYLHLKNAPSRRSHELKPVPASDRVLKSTGTNRIIARYYPTFYRQQRPCSPLFPVHPSPGPITTGVLVLRVPNNLLVVLRVLSRSNMRPVAWKVLLLIFPCYGPKALT